MAYPEKVAPPNIKMVSDAFANAKVTIIAMGSTRSAIAKQCLQAARLGNAFARARGRGGAPRWRGYVVR